MADLLVPSRFCGPPDSGNGGWVSGAVATLLGDDLTRAVTVTLRRPPPLDRPLQVTREGETLSVHDADNLIAEATGSETGPTPPEPVTLAQAHAAETSYAGLSDHPFPTCVVCGTGREPGDGLRIFTGRVEDQTSGDRRLVRTAATWTPDPSVAAEDDPIHASRAVTWGALDCPGAWAADLSERLLVLGRITAQLRSLPRIGETYVVVGLARGAEGRTHFTATGLFDAEGQLVGAAEHTWISVGRDFGA